MCRIILKCNNFVLATESLLKALLPFCQWELHLSYVLFVRNFSVGKSSVNDGTFCGSKKSCNYEGVSWSVCKKSAIEPLRSVHYSRSHSKKVLKQALRQQAKRRRKNTKIAAINSAPVLRQFPKKSEDGKNRISYE